MTARQCSLPWYARLVRRRRRFKDRFWKQSNLDGAQNDGWPEKTGNCGRSLGGKINRTCRRRFSLLGAREMLSPFDAKARQENKKSKADELRVLTIRTLAQGIYINVTIVNYSITTAVVMSLFMHLFLRCRRWKSLAILRTL